MSNKQSAKIKTGSVMFGAQTYKTVQIGSQVWLAENLNVKIDGSSCYEDDPANCEKYGRLYTWEAAKAVANQIENWHLPTDGEWDELCKALGGTYTDKDDWGYYEDIGIKLKQDGSSSFNALLAGYRDSVGDFDLLGDYGLFWSASPNGSSYTWSRYVNASSSNADRNSSNRMNRFSVRLVKD